MGARGIAALLLVAVLSGCGAEGGRTGSPGTDATGTPAGPSTGAEAVAYPGTVWLSATGIRTTRNGVALDVELPAGAPGCGVRPRVRVSGSSDDLVRVVATVHTSGEPACVENVPATLTVDLAVRSRDLSVNHELWEPGPGTSYVRCGGMGCDPPRDRCDPLYTHSVGAGADIPPERHLEVLACDAPWLVADVDAVVTGCQSVDGSTPPPGCDVFTRRWFAHLEDGTWRLVAAGTAGGCAEVLAQVPAFPRRLCAGLPPLVTP